MGCLSLLLEPDNEHASHGAEPATDSGDGQVVQGSEQADQESHAIPGRLYRVDARHVKLARSV